MSEMLATFQRVARAVGDEHAANLDVDAHLEEITRIVVRGRETTPSRLPRIDRETTTETREGATA